MLSWLNETLDDESNNSVDRRQSLLDEMSRESVRVRELVRLRTEAVISGVVGSVRTVESVRVHANALRQRLLDLDERLAKLEVETSDSVLGVAKLDAVRDKMKRCVDALAAAERVASLAVEMEQLFQQNNSAKTTNENKVDSEDNDSLHRVALLVVEMRDAVRLLKGTARYADESNRLERMERRLETLSAPRVRLALAKHDIAEARRMLRIYHVVGRVEHFEALYEAHWKRRVIDDCWALFDDDGDSFVGWLGEQFCDTVAGVIARDEARFGEQLFNDKQRRRGRRLLCRCATLALRSLHRSFAERMQGTTIDMLVAIHQCLDAKLLRPLLAVLLDDNDDDDQDDDDDDDDALRRDLVLAVFEPMHAAQNGYADAERECVERELAHVERAQLAVVGEPSTLLNHVKQSAPQVLAIVQQAFSRCMALTGGIEADRAIDALGALLGAHLTKHQLGIVLPALIKSSVSVSVPATSQSDVSEQHDWHHFQSSLQLLQVAIDFGQELRTVDRHMASVLADSQLDIGTLTPFTSHLMASSVNADRRRRIETFLSNTRSERMLLGDAFDAFNAWHSACEAFAFDCMFAFIQQTLARVPTMSHIWESSSLSFASSSSPQPSAYILHIKEHLLSLPEQLEPFALAQQRNSNLIPPSPSKHDDAQVHRNDTNDDNDDDDDDLSTGFVYQWLTTVSRGTMAEFEKRIAQIPKLSHQGARQLMLDIRYLSNIFDAIGIGIKSSLSTIGHALSLPPSQRSSFLDANRHSPSLHHALQSLFASIVDNNDQNVNQNSGQLLTDV